MLLVVLICFDDHGSGTISSDAAHLAQCGMLRASPDASGRPCRASVCDVSPGRCHGHPSEVDSKVILMGHEIVKLL